MHKLMNALLSSGSCDFMPCLSAISLSDVKNAQTQQHVEHYPATAY